MQKMSIVVTVHKNVFGKIGGNMENLIEIKQCNEWLKKYSWDLMEFKVITNENKDSFLSELIYLVVRKNDLDVLNALVAESKFATKKNEMGYTPLHEAVFYKHRECFLPLLKGGANPNERNQFGETPLQMAKRIDKKLFDCLTDTVRLCRYG